MQRTASAIDLDGSRQHPRQQLPRCSLSQSVVTARPLSCAHASQSSRECAVKWFGTICLYRCQVLVCCDSGEPAARERQQLLHWSACVWSPVDAHRLVRLDRVQLNFAACCPALRRTRATEKRRDGPMACGAHDTHRASVPRDTRIRHSYVCSHRCSRPCLVRRRRSRTRMRSRSWTR